MKTKFLFTLMMVFVLHAKAQVQSIQITRDDFPKEGSNYFYNVFKGQTAGIDTLTAGATGSGASWDFSKLSAITSQPTIDTVKVLTLANWNKIDTLPKSYSRNAFPASNLVIADRERVKFLSDSQDSVNILGEIYAGDTNVQRFTPPLTVAKFPITFHSNVVDSSWVILTSAYKSTSGGGTVIDPDSIRTILFVKSRDTSDAWGTIKTPVSQYQALRVINYKTYKRTYQVKTNGGSWVSYKSNDTLPIADTVEYQWWAKGIGKEVFCLKSAVPARNTTTPTLAGNSSIVAKVAWYTGTSIVTGTDNSLPATLLTVGPNPNNGSFSIAGDKAISGVFTLSIQDIQGRQLYTDKMQGLNKSYDLPLSEGMYCVKITAEDGRSLVKKIVVTR